MIQSDKNIKNSKIGILGLTFKENCPDLRNTRVVDIVRELASYGADVLVHDPMADAGEAMEYYGIELCPWEDIKDLDALIMAVPHDQYRKNNVHEFVEKLNPGGWLIDVKSMLDKQAVDQSDVNFWRV